MATEVIFAQEMHGTFTKSFCYYHSAIVSFSCNSPKEKGMPSVKDNLSKMENLIQKNDIADYMMERHERHMKWGAQAPHLKLERKNLKSTF